MDMINQRTIEQVYERADIVDVVSDYVELRKAGVNYKGLCPFHQDHAPSLIVPPARWLSSVFSYLSHLVMFSYSTYILLTAQYLPLTQLRPLPQDPHRLLPPLIGSAA